MSLLYDGPQKVPLIDVVVLGGGIAGLTLARHLLMYTDKNVLLLEKRPQIPGPRQKVGESNVQVQGYYLGKVLDLEEHLFHEHVLKYNLRFYWPTVGCDNDGYEEYSQSYIRSLSNICCFQLDRNKIEAELVRLNSQNPRFTLQTDVSDPDVSLATNAHDPHHVTFRAAGETREVRAKWVVDTSGRARFLARRLGLTKSNPIRHGSVFFWVDGLLNIEKLTPLSHSQMLLHKNRRQLGHIPAWLATNHFCGEGYWFWVIPLQGKTSLGLVYDRRRVDENEVSSPEKVIEWVCRRHPLFAKDLPKQRIIDKAMYRDFSYDCKQTISAERWALAGEAGRFTDPLYSPGGDLISLYNTLIVDSILTENESTLAVKARLYELLMWGLYEAYVPSYATSYDALGDQECFAMKYGWELTIYFTFYVFPFINHRFTDTAFVVPYLDLFARLGPLNNSIQAFITSYYHWKKTQPKWSREPSFFEFTGFEPLRKAEELFYKVGLSARECIKTLRYSLENIENLARFVAVYIYSVVLDDDSLLTNKDLITAMEVENLSFDLEAMRRQCSGLSSDRDPSLVKLGAEFIKHFRGPAPARSRRAKTVAATVSIAGGAKRA